MLNELIAQHLSGFGCMVNLSSEVAHLQQDHVLVHPTGNCLDDWEDVTGLQIVPGQPMCRQQYTKSFGSSESLL